MLNLNDTIYLKKFIESYWKENIKNQDYICEFIESEVFIDNNFLMSWLTENYWYFEDAVENWLIVFNGNFNFIESIRMAQYCQIDEDFQEELNEYLENIWQE